MSIESNELSKRDRILDAAVQTFSHKGYYDTKMDEVAVLAGTAKGTIFFHFESKLQLFQEIINRAFISYFENIYTENATVLSFYDRLIHIFEAHFRFCQDNKELSKIVFWDTEYVDSELKDWSYEVYKSRIEKLIHIIDEAKQKGEIGNVNTELIAWIISGLMRSFLPIVDSSLNVRKTAEAFADVLLNGIGKEI